jgi:hypothetical protein
MKKLLLIISTLTTPNLKAQTSIYYPFPEDSATWCEGLCIIQPQYSIDFYAPATSKLDGKVLINNNWYSRMIHHSENCDGAMSCICATLNGSDDTTYYIRQDTAQKKVWIYVPSTNSDTIFLDFNLNVGDTIDGSKEYWAEQVSGSGQTIVTSIDSVLIGSQYRKRFNYSYNGFNNTMIEGIGPTHGLFLLANQGYDYATGLGIFSQNNQIFYPSYSPDTTGMGQYCYNFPTAKQEINKTSFIFSFPNPSTRNFTLYFGQYLSKGSIEIYSAIGEKVWNEYINNESKKEINLKNISDGIYFVKVFDGEKSYCKKLIVKHD